MAGHGTISSEPIVYIDHSDVRDGFGRRTQSRSPPARRFHRCPRTSTDLLRVLRRRGSIEDDRRGGPSGFGIAGASHGNWQCGVPEACAHADPHLDRVLRSAERKGARAAAGEGGHTRRRRDCGFHRTIRRVHSLRTREHLSDRATPSKPILLNWAEYGVITAAIRPLLRLAWTYPPK